MNKTHDDDNNVDNDKNKWDICLFPIVISCLRASAVRTFAWLVGHIIVIIIISSLDFLENKKGNDFSQTLSKACVCTFYVDVLGRDVCVCPLCW